MREKIASPCEPGTSCGSASCQRPSLTQCARSRREGVHGLTRRKSKFPKQELGKPRWASKRAGPPAGCARGRCPNPAHGGAPYQPRHGKSIVVLPDGRPENRGARTSHFEVVGERAVHHPSHNFHCHGAISKFTRAGWPYPPGGSGAIRKTGGWVVRPLVTVSVTVASPKTAILSKHHQTQSGFPTSQKQRQAPGFTGLACLVAEACGNRTHLARVRRHTGFEDQEGHQAQSASVLVWGCKTHRRRARISRRRSHEEHTH